MVDIFDFAHKSEYKSFHGRGTGDFRSDSLLIILSAPVCHLISAEYTNRPIVGSRELIRMHTEEKEITKKVDGEDVKGEWGTMRSCS